MNITPKMKKNKLLLLVILLLSATTGYGQLNYQGDGYGFGTGQIYFSPTNEEYDPEKINNVPAVAFRFENVFVDTKAMLQNYPEAQVAPETFKMTLPDLTGVTDTVVMLTALKHRIQKDADIVNALIIANAGSEEGYYFVDRNNNRDFTDDGAPIKMSKTQRSVEATIKSENEQGKVLRYTYEIPNLYNNDLLLRTLGIEKDDLNYFANEELAPITLGKIKLLTPKGRLSLFVDFGIGNGDWDFSYAVLNNNQISGRKYVTTINAIQAINASVAYAWQNFNIGARVSLEGSQLGENRLVNTLSSSAIESVPNTGTWPRSRAIFSAFAEYDIHIDKNIYFSPYFEYGTYTFTKNGVFINSRVNTTVNTSLEYNDIFMNRTLMSVGAKVKFGLSRKTLLFGKFTYNETSFDLSEDFIVEDHDPTTIDTNNTSFTGGIGVQVLLAN